MSILRDLMDYQYIPPIEAIQNPSKQGGKIEVKKLSEIEKHIERLGKNAKYRAENRDLIRATQKKWEKANPESRKIRQVRWRSKKNNHEFQLMKCRKFRYKRRDIKDLNRINPSFTLLLSDVELNHYTYDLSDINSIFKRTSLVEHQERLRH